MKKQRNTATEQAFFGFVLANLRQICQARLEVFSGKKASVKPPDLVLPKGNQHFAAFVKQFQPSFEEYSILLLALAPHLQSDFFDNILADFFPDGSHLPAFGGVRGKNHRGILPTGETVQFIVAGNDLHERLRVRELFRPDHWFATQSILRLEEVPVGEPVMSGRLLLDSDWLDKLTTGKVLAPRFSTRFPAERLETQLSWDDLVLPARTLSQVRELEVWWANRDGIKEDWNLARHLKPGFRALFHGPPGTGKTLTVSLIGQNIAQPVFRVDLSMVVSKYIGETEKNLATLFDKASNKGWILFFDEADALFGKRTEVRDAHDKYANQEVSYLLQRVESYPGLVILASNFRTNVDTAFARRFQSIIHFPMPDASLRLLLWQKVLPDDVPLADDVDVEALARQFELSGSNIVNVVQYSILQMLGRGDKALSNRLLLEGIRREMTKEGKLV